MHLFLSIVSSVSVSVCVCEIVFMAVGMPDVTHLPCFWQFWIDIRNISKLKRFWYSIEYTGIYVLPRSFIRCLRLAMCLTGVLIAQFLFRIKLFPLSRYWLSSHENNIQNMEKLKIFYIQQQNYSLPISLSESFRTWNIASIYMVGTWDFDAKALCSLNI